MSSKNAPSRIGGILLAAGDSSRMGQPKQLLPFRGISLLRHAAEELVASRCAPVAIVLGSQADRMRCELSNLPVEIAVNDRWQTGMGSSLKCGMEKLLGAGHATTGEIAGVLIAVCDQPFMDRALLAKLLHAHANGADRVACEYGGTLGVPALFGREWLDALAALEDAQGAKNLLATGAGEKKIARVPFAEGASDLDTLEDYEQLVHRIKRHY